MIAPVFDGLAKEFPSVRFYKIDIDNKVGSSPAHTECAAGPTIPPVGAAKEVVSGSGGMCAWGKGQNVRHPHSQDMLHAPAPARPPSLPALGSGHQHSGDGELRWGVGPHKQQR